MGTRAIYTFKDSDGSHNVFVHYDGYPTGAATYFRETMESGKVWGWQRYEADEFAAGFVAAVKSGSGNVRLTKSRRAYADVEFGYTVYQKNGTLRVKVHAIDGWDTWKETLLLDTTLLEFIEGAAAELEQA